MFNKILGLFKSSEKAVDTAADLAKDVSSGIDKIWFTKEEQAELSAEERRELLQARKEGFEFWIKAQSVLQNENSAQSMARRDIAKGIVAVFLGLLVFSAIIYRVDPGWATKVAGLAASMYELVLMIAGFYFTYYGINQVVERVKGKKGK